MVEGDDIYGDGVNVAARLQALASPGGIAVSASSETRSWQAHDCLEDLGEQTLKNIVRTVRVFALRPDGAASRAPRPTGEPGGRKRVSLCVLPFANMSGDPEQEYFSDGITEDIITDLTKVSAALGGLAQHRLHLQRAGRSTCRRVARQLKVSHVLEGSVRKAGGTRAHHGPVDRGLDRRPRLGRAL